MRAACTGLDRSSAAPCARTKEHAPDHAVRSARKQVAYQSPRNKGKALNGTDARSDHVRWRDVTGRGRAIAPLVLRSALAGISGDFSVVRTRQTGWQDSGGYAIGVQSTGRKKECTKKDRDALRLDTRSAQRTPSDSSGPAGVRRAKCVRRASARADGRSTARTARLDRPASATDHVTQPSTRLFRHKKLLTSCMTRSCGCWSRRTGRTTSRSRPGRRSLRHSRADPRAFRRARQVGRE